MIETGVYAIRCTVDGKSYVGSAGISFEKRWWQHRNVLRKGTHYNSRLQRAWDKHGEDAFLFEILERCEPVDCLDRENHYLATMGVAHPSRGYNICPYADSAMGRECSEETRKKISASNKGKQNFLGKKHSEEWKARMRAINRGELPTSEKNVRRMASMKDRVMTPEHKEAIREGVRSRVCTPEYRAKLSATSKGHTRSCGEKNPRARLTEDQAREIRRRYRAYSLTDGTKALAAEFNVCVGTLEAILSGRNWPHLAVEIPLFVATVSSGVRPAQSGESNGLAKLTEADVIEIRARYRQGGKENGYLAIAKDFKVTSMSIRNIVKRKTWRHVAE